MKYIVSGQKLNAKEWKTKVSMALEEAIKHLDDLIPWENDSMLQGEGTNEYYVYYTLHIAKG